MTGSLSILLGRLFFSIRLKQQLTLSIDGRGVGVGLVKRRVVEGSFVVSCSPAVSNLFVAALYIV